MAEMFAPFATDESGNSLGEKPAKAEKKPKATVDSAVSEALTSASGDATAFISKLEELGFKIVPAKEKNAGLDGAREAVLEGFED
jgi:hypothetical protein